MDGGDGKVTAEWGKLSAADAMIDATDAGVGAGIFELNEYSELMRGKGQVGGAEWLGSASMPDSTSKDTPLSPSMATSPNPLHRTCIRTPTEIGASNTVAIGYWHDDWIRTAEDWRTSFRRVEDLFIQTFPDVETAPMLSGLAPTSVM